MSCGTPLPLNSRFCNNCGVPVAQSTRSAEYKHVTVLFADVVHSMDIAATVGAERLREIMAGLLDRAMAVVGRHGGTVDKFTGDGLMAMFGAPIALEDHAVRACRAALDIDSAISDLAEQVRDWDGVELQLRIGLNSGQVIAGEIGSGVASYTAIGEQVGMAQRMESVAPPGGVMLSASTARLVEAVTSLGDPELVHIKGVDQPVPAYRLLGLLDGLRPAPRAESALVGRRWEMGAVEGLLVRAVEGRGAVVTVSGSPGIGKSRMVRELSAMSAARGVEVFTAYCEAHTTDVSFHVLARLLREATGIRGLDGAAARALLRDRNSDADPEDLLLLDDLLGIGDPESEPPKVDPDARRRRLTALVTAASLAREAAAVYVIEDVHWIDEVSESMLVDFLSVIPQTPSLVLISYRPEYRGSLSTLSGAQNLALSPLSDSEIGALVTGLLGLDISVRDVTRLIAEKAAGNPFFAEEMVRDLAERGVLQGQPARYLSTADVATVSMPATVHATIAARIDRLSPGAKRTLSAAAVIGSKFRRDLLYAVGVEPELDELLRGGFIDQTSFARHPNYVFHHPLIRTVAYESQLKSDRCTLHRRLAAALQARAHASCDENAALIADHLEAAGDLHDAYDWHMRAAGWATNRDINAARLGWERAQTIADALPIDDPNRLTMRIAPRTMLCGTAWRVHADVSGVYLEELRNLCTTADDKVSLAIATSGLVSEHMIHGRAGEGSRVVAEQLALIESIGDPTLTLGLSTNFISVKQETGEISAVLRVAENMIAIAEGDAAKSAGIMGLGSPMGVALAARGFARCRLGHRGWLQDFNRATELSKDVDPVSRAIILAYKYSHAIPIGALRPGDGVLREVEESATMSKRFSDDIAVGMTAFTLGLVLIHRTALSEIERGIDVLADASDMCRDGRFYRSVLPTADLYAGWALAKLGDVDGSIPLMRGALDKLYETAQLAWGVTGSGIFVETLLDRATDANAREAEAVVQRLARTSVDDTPVRDIWLLRSRALLAGARGDANAYRDFRDRYRDMARALGYEVHIDRAEAMP